MSRTAEAASSTNAASFSSTDVAAAGNAEVGDAERAPRFGLIGRSPPLDPRVHAYRRDIADVALAGRVIAPHYAERVLRACGSRATMVWSTAAAQIDAVSELLPGEGFAVLEYTGRWAWGYCTADRRVGYVEAIALTDPAEATHIVCEASVPVFAGGAIGAARLATMPMGARLRGYEAGACLTSEMGCVPLSHLRRIDERECDPAGVAKRLIGARWLVGGRSHLGVDAAALIQLALGPCGVATPRDLDQQRELGSAVIGSRLRRGDVVIAGEEGGVMIDDLMLIHASRTAGKVTVEPVSCVEARHSESVRRRADV